MPDLELNKVKDEFKQSMESSLKLIRSINKTQPRFSQEQICLIYELSFLRIFLGWEWFIENTFVLYMLGEKTNKGYRPKTYVKPVNYKHAYEFVRGEHNYVNWTNPDVIIKKSTLFFEDGQPFKDVLVFIKQEIRDMKTIRNAIVHMSTKSREEFKDLIRIKLGYVKSDITPGEFLHTSARSQNVPYITYFRVILKAASERIVK